MAALRSPDLIRAAKPPAIGVFGDIAVAVGPDFLPFLDAVLIILNQAAATEVTDVSALSQGPRISTLPTTSALYTSTDIRKMTRKSSSTSVSCASPCSKRGRASCRASQTARSSRSIVRGAEVKLGRA